MSTNNAAVNIKLNIRSDQIIIILCRSTEHSNTLEDVWYSYTIVVIFVLYEIPLIEVKPRSRGVGETGRFVCVWLE